MAIDQNLIIRKLEFLDRHLTAIERMEFNEQKFSTDEDIHDLVTFRLQQAVETAIDIANLLINSLGLPLQETAHEALLSLGKRKILNQKLAGKMGKAADFRNRVVHGYNNFDYKELFNDYKKDVADLRQFGKEILTLLENKKSI